MRLQTLTERLSEPPSGHTLGMCTIQAKVHDHINQVRESRMSGPHAEHFGWNEFLIIGHLDEIAGVPVD